MPKRKSQEQEAATAQSETSSTITDAIVEAYRKWINDQQEAQQEYQNRTAEAYRNLIETVQSILKEASQPVRDAVWRLVATSSTANLSQQNMEKYQAAYQEYIKALQDYQGSQDLQKQYQEAIQRYSETINEAASDGQKRSEQAYRDYVRALKQAWTDIDPDTVDLNAFFSAMATTSPVGK
jgi:Asp-tRNA(Asn)/Glu-tRNA(Gln) amidotransferase A subunit family amidase